MAPALSIVIPAYGEARRLPATLAKLAAYVSASTPVVEVLIVVERSPDATLTLAREFTAGRRGFEVIDNGPQRGKGHAVRAGMLRARGAQIFYLDADLSVPLAEIAPFLLHLERNPQTSVLIGDRQHPRSRITRRQSWLRERMGQTFNRVLQRLSLVPWKDTQCGFKAFRHDAAREIFSRQKLDGFAFDVEVLLLATQLGYQIEALPVEWINSAESKVRIVRDSLRMLRDALRMRRVFARATLRIA